MCLMQLYVSILYTLYLSSNLKPGVVVSKRLSCVLRGFSTSSFSVAKITRIRLGRQTPLSLWKAWKTRESTNYIKKKPHGTVVVMMLPKASVQHLPKTDAFIKIDLPWGLPTFAADSWMVSRKSIFCRHGSNRSPPPNCLERHRC